MVDALAARHGVDPALLAGWLDTLGIGGPPAAFASLLTTKREAIDGYAFVKAWDGDRDLRVAANASPDTVRVPGTMRPHGITVHPAPQRRVLIGWKSPLTAAVRGEGTVQRAHVGCGTGLPRALEAWRGGRRQRLAGGTLDHGRAVAAGPVGPCALREGDAIVLAVGSRDGNHSCDTTAVDLTIRAEELGWDLAADVSGDLLAANPHADAHGNEGVWHFASEDDAADPAPVVPPGSLLDRWQSAATAEARTALAAAVQRLLESPPPDAAADATADVKASPADAALRRSLLSLGGPILGHVDTLPSDTVTDDTVPGDTANADGAGACGLDPALFGRHPRGLAVGDADLCMPAPGVITLRIPAAFATGRALVTAATLHPAAAGAASFQPQVRLGGAAPDAVGLSPALPVVAGKDSPAWRRLAAAFADFRGLFPRAICYTRIVPVDEVVTLNVYYREDDQLRRLRLDDAQAAELDRLWDELLFVSREPLELADAHEQLLGYASQDRGDLTGPLARMRPFILARAAAFRDRERVAEPAQLDAVVALAERAYRRP
jgi:hypothetical protein